MKVRSITRFLKEIPMEEFVGSELAKTPIGQLLIALVAETVWSGEYSVCYERPIPILEIHHPAFLPGQPPLVIREGPDATVDGVKEAVLAHIDTQLKTLREQNAALQLKSASLSDASGNIYRAEAQAAVVAKFPNAVGCRLFAPHGGSDFTCFTQGTGFGHTIFVARGDCPEYSGGIVQIEMPGDDWHHLERAKKYERFWGELAMAFVVRELKIQENNLYWQKTYMKEELCAYSATEVQLRRRSVNEQIVVTFDADSLPAKAVQVPDNENAEV